MRKKQIYPITPVLSVINLLLELSLVLSYCTKGRFRFTSLTVGIVLFSSVTFYVLFPHTSDALIQFKDVSTSAGLSRWGDNFGASWGDVNGDGWADLWIGNHCQKPSLYLNRTDGTFADITQRVNYDSDFEQHGAAWADFDNDGDQDLIQIVGGGREKGIHPNQLFINSNGSLENKAVGYGLDYSLGRGRTPLWFDWNSDGYLDVFVTNIERTDGKSAPSALFTNSDIIFINENNITIENGPSSQFAQYYIPNVTSRPAIVVAGENAYPDRIYQYDTVPFRDIAASAGLPVTPDVSDAAIADFNNDLLNDFFMVTTQGVVPQKDRLLIQSSTGFKDATLSAGLDTYTSCWSVVASDFDNDMDMDLYLVCSSANCNSPNILYENNGNGTFAEINSAGGATGSSFGKSASVTTVDYDNDGFMDIFVANGRDSYDEEDGRNQLFRNAGNSNNWIEIDLEGVLSSRDGIGALLLVSSGGVTQMRVQDGGMHRYSQNHQRIHFGIGKHRLVKKLTVQWPSGIVQEMTNISANQILNVAELDFTSSASAGSPPLQVQFTHNNKRLYNPIHYEWDFDNDGIIDSTEINPSYTYKKPGIYNVKLRITDFNGKIYTSLRNDYIKLKGSR